MASNQPRKKRKTTNQNVGTRMNRIIIDDDSPLVISPGTMAGIKRSTAEYGKQWNKFMQTHLPKVPNRPQIPFNDDSANDGKQNEINALQQQIDKMHKNKLSTERKMESLLNKIKRLLLENNQLKLCVRGLIDMVKNGPNPQYDAVKMMKRENTSAVSLRLNAVKLKLNAYFPDNQCIDIQPVEAFDTEFIDDKSLKVRIEHFEQINANNQKRQSILIKKRTKKKKRKKSQNRMIKNDVFSISDCNQMQIDDVLQKVQIPKGHRIEKLVGQKGVISKIAIPKGTIIGKYSGNEYFEDEFDDVFAHSNEENLRNMYAMNAIVYIPTDDMIEKDDKFYQKAIQKNIIIDGWAHKDKNLLIFMNDCRKNIENELPTSEDKVYWNCSFRKAQINGYPMIYAVTRRDIEVGEELNVYYGTMYGPLVATMDRETLVKARVAGYLDNTIMNLVQDFDPNQQKEMYTIDV